MGKWSWTYEKLSGVEKHKGGRRAHRECRVEDEKPKPLAGLREVHSIDGRPVVGDLQAPGLGLGLGPQP